MVLYLTAGFLVLGIAGATQQIPEIFVPTPDYGQPLLTQTLLQHDFANSWNQQVGGSYSPPEFEFSNVKLTISVEVSGIQFDRLGHVWFNGVEVWRPSTPEPSNRDVTGTFTKDVSHLLPLFKSPGEFSVEIDNVVSGPYNGVLATKLTIEYYNANSSPAEIQESGWYASSPPSRVQAVGGLLTYYPPSTAFTLPQASRNTTQAVLQISASGNSNEEFWYTNTDSNGPSRVVAVSINGKLAGYADPFFEVYTGGINYPSWEGIVGINAYDVPSYYIDITAFLPTLWESDTTLNVDVMSNTGAGNVQSNWILNVGLLTWEASGVYGSGYQHTSDAPSQSVQQSSSNPYSLTVSNSITTSAFLLFNFDMVSVEWTQSLQAHYYLNSSDTWAAKQGSSSLRRVSSGDSSTFSNSYQYAIGLPQQNGQSNILQGYQVSVSKPDGSYNVDNVLQSIHDAGYQQSGYTQTTSCVSASGSFGSFSQQGESTNGGSPQISNGVSCSSTSSLTNTIFGLKSTQMGIGASGGNSTESGNNTVVTSFAGSGLGRAPAWILNRQ